MHSYFQDSKFSDDNKKLYEVTPESDLTRNVNPVAQLSVFNEMKKRKRFIQLQSLSPEPTSQSIFHSNNLIPATTNAAAATSQTTTAHQTKKSRIQSNSTSLSQLPSLYFATSPDQPTTSLGVEDQKKQKKKLNSVFDMNSAYQTSSQAAHTADQLHHQKFGSTILNSGSNSNLLGAAGVTTAATAAARKESNNSKQFMGFVAEDRREQERASRSGFIKQKYESLMKNTFCLRSKLSHSTSIINTSNHINSTSSSHNNNISSLATHSSTRYSNSNNNIINESDLCPIGIFLQKPKEPPTLEDNGCSKRQNGISNNNNNSQNQRFDSIYKLMKLDQQVPNIDTSISASAIAMSMLSRSTKSTNLTPNHSYNNPTKLAATSPQSQVINSDPLKKKGNSKNHPYKPMFEIAGSNQFSEEYSRRIKTEALNQQNLIRSLDRNKFLPPVVLPATHNTQQKSIFHNPQFSNTTIQTVLMNSPNISDPNNSKQTALKSNVSTDTIYAAEYLPLDAMAKSQSSIPISSALNNSLSPHSLLQPIVRSEQSINMKFHTQQTTLESQLIEKSSEQNSENSPINQHIPANYSSLMANRQGRQLKVAAVKSSSLLRQQSTQMANSALSVSKQFQLISDSEDETSSPLVTLHNAISTLHNQELNSGFALPFSVNNNNNNAQNKMMNYSFSEDSEIGSNHDEEECNSGGFSPFSSLRNPYQSHKTINQSKYKNFSAFAFGNGDGNTDDNENNDSNNHDHFDDTTDLLNKESSKKNLLSLKLISDQIDNHQVLKQAESIFDENPGNNPLSNEHIAQVEQEEAVEENDGSGFVLKRKIDFDSLRDLRDRTINRINLISTPQSPLTPSTAQQQQSSHHLPKRQLLNLVLQSKLTRQNSTSTNSPSKIKKSSTPSPQKLQHQTSIMKSSRFIEQPPPQQSTEEPPVTQAGDKRELGSSQTQTPSSQVKPNSTTTITKKSKGTKESNKVESTLRQFFRKPQKKKPAKVVDDRNAEEVQREQDQGIATKLVEVKDKLRAGVKEVIKDSIQKRIKSSLAQSILSSVSTQMTAATTTTTTTTTSNGISEVLPQQQQQTSSNKDSRTSLSSTQNKFTRLTPAMMMSSSSQNSFATSPSPLKTKTHDSYEQFTQKSKFDFAASAIASQQSNNNGQQQNTAGTTGAMQNPSYTAQLREVQEYSSAVMDFYDMCIDNLNEKSTPISHEFSLQNLKNFDVQMSENLKKAFEAELRKTNMSSADVERFKYIYEINTKMYVFYQGMIRTLGGVENVKRIVEVILKKVSSHITLFPINHVYSFDAMHRRIIPSICALLCDDHRLFLQTLRAFQQSNSADLADFSFIDFFFIKKELFSLLTKKKHHEFSTNLALSIMQKIESVRRYIFPLDILSNIELRATIASKLAKKSSFMDFFNVTTFQQEQILSLVNAVFDYFYADSDDVTIIDFQNVKRLFEKYLSKKLTRKVFDCFEAITQTSLLKEDKFTRNVVLRDLHYKFSKMRLRFGFKQGVFGIVKFEQTQSLITQIQDDLIRAIYLESNSQQIQQKQQLDDDEEVVAAVTKSEQQEAVLSTSSIFKGVDLDKIQDLSFLKFYLQFVLSEYDMFSVYDFSVAMPYYGVTLRIFRIWMSSLRNVLLTKYGILPSKANVFIRFLEACCPTT